MFWSIITWKVYCPPGIFHKVDFWVINASNTVENGAWDDIYVDRNLGCKAVIKLY